MGRCVSAKQPSTHVSASAQTSTHILRVLTLAGLGSLIAATACADEPGFFYGGISSDERDNGYKLFGGYQLNRNIGFEAGYFDVGKTTFSATAPGGAFNNDTRMRGLNLDLVGTLPITDKFSLLGRVGVAMGRTRASFTGAGAAGVADRNDNKANAKVGLGVQYEINRSFWVRGEVERYRVNNGVGGRLRGTRACTGGGPGTGATARELVGRVAVRL